MTKYLLAHDIGTSGNKATLFTSEGESIESKTVHYETNYLHDNWAEQNPEDWWNAVCDSTKALIRNIDPGSIASVSFSAQMMGCLCVDKQGNPLRDSIIYSDQRATKEAETIARKIDPVEFYKICGHRISAVYSLEKLMWLKENSPETYKNTYKMLNAKDYIVYKLTGEFATDHTDASGTNLYDIVKKEWSTRIVELSKIEGEMLPDIYHSTHVIGEVSRQAARETGLKYGTPVVIGAGDGSAAGIGVGCIKPGSAYTYLGSSAWVAMTTEEPFYDERMRTMTWANAIPNLYHPSGSMQTAGSSYQWIKNEVCKIETKEAWDRGISPYDIINEEIANSTAGSRGIIFLPYLMGERSPHWNPNAKGAFIGIKLTNKREDILRAVLEGITFNLNMILDIFKSKINIDNMVLVGGGAKGKVWRQIIADVFDVKILIPNYLEEATSIGAAVIGGVGVGALNDFNDIERFIRITETVEPIKANREIYRKSEQLFRDTYDSLIGVFEKY
jgi:xylulokinase